MAPACCVGAQTTNRTYLRAIPTTTGGGAALDLFIAKSEPRKRRHLIIRSSVVLAEIEHHLASGFVDTNIDPDGNSMPRMMELA